MSTTPFVEALSEDPYVRELHRRAMRVLNDPTLDRQQRESLVRRIQSALMEHQQKTAAMQKKAASEKTSQKPQEGVHGTGCVAHPSQVVARRKELAAASPAREEEVPLAPVPVARKVLPAAGPAANDSDVSGRRRPLLVLKRA